MTDIKMILIKNDSKQYNITNYCGVINRSDNIDNLGMQLSFEVAKNRTDKYMIGYDNVELGDKVVFFNNDIEVFRGIIVDLTTSKFVKNVTALDYAFYLNQSKTIKQFNNVIATKAIKDICNKFGVQIGNITNISTQINKIYNNKTIANIIKDIILQATNELGIEYRLEMRAGKLYIEPYKNLVVKGFYKPATNLGGFDITKAIGSDISKQESLKDRKNSVIVSSENEKSTRILATAKDDESISNVGLLQEVVSVDNKNESKAKNIANNKLKLLNKNPEDISLSMMGDDNIRAGRIINIEEKNTQLSGNYLIKNCRHTYINNNHKVNVNLKSVVI